MERRRGGGYTDVWAYEGKFRVTRFHVIKEVGNGKSPIPALA